MPRASATLAGVAVEEKKLAAVWVWPLLVIAFVVFGLIGAGAVVASWFSSTPTKS